MELCKIVFKKLILVIVLMSILITFVATPVSNAKLDLESGDFYYSGTTEGAYRPNNFNIFNWLLKALGDIADFILGILTLGFRMVIVGWTALIEKLLTWGIESASGVNASGGAVNDTGTISIITGTNDLTDITDSGNNITVESIVYNKVAAFDVDLFDLEYDRTLSATGHRLVCSKCYIAEDRFGIEQYMPKYVDECIDKDIQDAIIAEVESGAKTSVYGFDKDGSLINPCGTDCKCDGCLACQKYVEQLRMKEPIIIRLKQTIAAWYYIIRTIAMAAMLAVLIFVGIKMAISTIASDKAVYKRMLVDWVVGVIILFSMHYFMVFVINLNEIMVRTVEETANSVNQTIFEDLKDELNIETDEDFTSKDLEIRVYEEIRTRAYDAKLSNGMMGMIMYMALVFMAVKYTFIYLKRLLTIMVLALMAPAVGVAYALQKVLSGKSSALKTWMTEFIMNVIIQIVHALIYAIFISQALLLSLTNISGMFIALVLMNYSSKAEESFKKIFKFGGSDSLLGQTDNAMESMRENLETARKVVIGAKPVANMLTNTPYAKALKGVGKVALAGAVVGASKVYDKRQEGKEAREDKQYKRQLDREERRETRKSKKSGGTPISVDVARQTAEATLRGKGILPPAERRAQEQALLETEPGKFDTDVTAATNKYNEAKKNLNANPNSQQAKDDLDAAQKDLQQAQDRKSQYQQLTAVTTGDIIRGHAEKLFELENYFHISAEQSGMEKVNAISDGIFGSVYFDKNKMKYVRRDDGIYHQFTAERLLGFTKEDKKMFKEQVIAPITQGLTGMGCLFVGMGTMVMEPKLGMALLAKGIPSTYRVFKKPSKNEKYKGRYAFKRFGIGAIENMKDTAIAEAQKDLRAISAEHMKKARPGFVQRLKTGDVSAVTLAVAAPLALGIKATQIGAKGARMGVKATTGVAGIAARTTMKAAALPVKAVLHPKKTGAAVASAIRTGYANTATAMQTGYANTSSAIKTGYRATANWVKHPINNSKPAVRRMATTMATTMGTNIKKASSSTGNYFRNVGNATIRPIRNMKKFATDTEYRRETVSGAIETAKLAPRVMADVGTLTTGRFIRNMSIQDNLAAVEKHSLKQRIKQEKAFKKETANIMGLQQQAILEVTINNADKLVEKEMNKQGYEYKATTGEMVRKDTVEIADIKPLKGKSTVKARDAKLVDQKIDSILDKFVKDGRLDLSSKGTQQKIIEELTTELVSANLIEAGQDATTVFKEGRSGLIKTIKGKSKKINDTTEAKEKATALEKVLSKDEMQIVREEVAAKGTNVSVESIIGKIGGQFNPAADGSRQATGSENGSRVDTSKTGDVRVSFDDRKREAITAFVTANNATARTVKVDSPVKSKRKMMEAMEMMLPPKDDRTGAVEGNGDNAVKKAEPRSVESLFESIASTGKVSETVTFNPAEKKVAEEVFARLLEIKTLNEVTLRDTKPKEASKAYLKERSSQSMLEIQKRELEKKLKELDSEGVGIDNLPEAKKKTAKDIQQELSKKQEELQRSDDRLIFTGPVVNIGDMIKNMRDSSEYGSIRTQKVGPKKDKSRKMEIGTGLDEGIKLPGIPGLDGSRRVPNDGGTSGNQNKPKNGTQGKKRTTKKGGGKK